MTQNVFYYIWEHLFIADVNSLAFITKKNAHWKLQFIRVCLEAYGRLRIGIPTTDVK